MKIRLYETGVLCAVAFLLIGSAAFAQTTTPSKTKSQTSSAGTASDRKSGSVIVLDREASSGQASGRQDQFPKASGAIADQGAEGPQAQLIARNSAHATESVAAQSGSDQKHNGSMAGAQSNPLYQPTGNSGANPLYESKDKSALRTNGNAAPAPQQYKDGEDGTTRTRPGNNEPAANK
jgi:hypothetical protein